MRNWLIVILFILFVQQKTFAQHPASFMFGQDQFEGIDIYNIIQDLDHNYWFATDQGLYLHDGYNFDKIECEEMKAHSVFNFVIDSNGIIYCCNLSQQVFKIENGKCSLIFEIPEKSADVHLLVSNKNELYISNSKRAYVLNDKHELIHISKSEENQLLGPPFLLKNGVIIQHLSNQAKLLKYENASSFIIPLKNYSSNSMGDNILRFYYYDNAVYCINNLINHVYKVNIESYSLEKTDIVIGSEKELLRYFPIDNTIWISDQISGAFFIDEKLRKNNKSIPSNKIFNDFFISYIYKDNEGNTLLATFDHGIIVIPDMSIMDVVPELSKHKITRIINANEKELYFGTRDGAIIKYDGELTTLSEHSNKSVEFLYYWPQKQLLLEDTKNLSVHFPNKKTISLAYGSLKDAISIGEDDLLLALNSGLISVTFNDEKGEFKITKKFLDERTYAVVQEENSNRIYVSTSSGIKYKGESDDFKVLTYNGKSVNVFDLASYQNHIYATSAKEGIYVLQKGKVIQIIKPHYNNSPLIIFKMIIKNDFIYANTQLGLVILNMKGEVINFLNKSNGLTANKIIDFELFKNELWVTHAKGIQRFHLEKINTRVVQPSIILSEILIHNEDIVDLNEVGNFNSNQRDLKFSFQVPTIKYRENISYHFKLEGYQEEWNINTYENNVVEYNALAPGSYRFVVKAENNNVYSESAYYSFTISTPFYQRWWFLALLVGAAIFLISAFYLRLLNIQKRKAKQINELNASRLTAIQSQMNPHFIFNSLNSIQALVLKGDIDNSYNFITKFSNLVRRTLNYSDKDFIDFDQEIELIILYLSLEKLRYKEDLEYTIHTNNVEDIKVPPMLIQPFIENALVHGLLHKEGKKCLTITFRLEDVLICEIIDNGIGREKAQEIKHRQGNLHESFAVNAIKRRFKILMNHFDGKLGFSMEDIISEGKVQGTKVILRIPVQLNF